VNVRCIAIDFDYTVAHFSDPAEKGLFDIFRRRGVDEITIIKVYEDVVRRGFSIDKFAREIETCNADLDLSDMTVIRQEFDVWLKNALELYEDTLPAMEQWRKLGIPIVFVTAGVSEHQLRKITLVGIPYDDVRVVSPPKRKSEVLEQIVDRYGSPVIFIDDKVDDLQETQKRLDKKVVAVHIYRSDSPYKEKHKDHSGPRILSLAKVNTIINVLENGITIRRANRADISAIARVNSDVFLGNKADLKAAVDWITCWYNAFPLYQYFVAETAGNKSEVVGYVGWQTHGGFLRPEPVIELEQIGADPTVQGLGIGPRLEESIKDVIEWLRSVNDRIESHIDVVVWGYALNFNAMSIYAKKFSEGVRGMRLMYSDRAENMLRWKIPLIMPIRRDQ